MKNTETATRIHYRKDGRMPDECRNYERNATICNCTYEPCSRKGICCECIAYHRRAGELPACYFENDVERTYDRSIEAFLRQQRTRGL